MSRKILVIGYGRHGKDTVAEMLREHGFTWVTSSFFCAQKVVMPYFESIAKPYASVEECYQDRINHRVVWFNQITAYNSGNWSRLSQDILKEYDIYVGMRNRMEFEHSKSLYDAVVWVDASDRLPVEDTSSCQLTKEDADYVIDNNGPLENLKDEVDKFLKFVYNLKG